jgi:hypothetical protein
MCSRHHLFDRIPQPRFRTSPSPHCTSDAGTRPPSFTAKEDKSKSFVNQAQDTSAKTRNAGSEISW